MNIFLDLDGTLTDPSLGVTRCIAHALQTLGLPVPSAADLTWVIGPSLLSSFEKLGVADPHQALKIYRERYSDVGLFENQMYPAIPETLHGLKQAGHTLYLATAKSHVFARRITAHFNLSQYLSHEFGPELDGTHSDKSDLLAYALTHTGARIDNSVMVGDRIHDFTAAASVGMPSIGVRWGFGTDSELKQAGTLCQQPEELPELISTLT